MTMLKFKIIFLMITAAAILGPLGHYYRPHSGLGVNLTVEKFGNLRPLAAGERSQALTAAGSASIPGYAPWLGLEGKLYSRSTRNKNVEQFVHSNVGVRREYEWTPRLIDAVVAQLCKDHGTQAGMQAMKRFVAETWKMRSREGIYEVWRRTSSFLHAISDSVWLGEEVKVEARSIYAALVAEARAYLLANAQDPIELIGKEFKRNKIVILSDTHGNPDFDMFASQVVGSMREWNVDTVAIEREAIYQDIIDEFLVTGRVTSEVEFVARGGSAMGTWGPSYFGILGRARDKAIKVVCMDLRTSTIYTYRDGNDLMAKMIREKILKTKSRALVYVGAYHAIKNRSGVEGPYLGEHLRKMTHGRTFSVKQISAEREDFEVMDDVVKGTRLEGKSFGFITPGSGASFDAVVYHGWLNYGVRATWLEWSRIMGQQKGCVASSSSPYTVSPDKLLSRKEANTILTVSTPVFTHGGNTFDWKTLEAKQMVKWRALYAKPESVLSRLGAVIRPLIGSIVRPRSETQSAI